MPELRYPHGVVTISGFVAWQIQWPEPWGFPKIKGTCWGVPVIRIKV